ncbi:MAG: TetR family transcriptional regulator [Proteobacteria bacterium]|nr:TetR family transcriptional regulator [Pseudomonadota bacterium]
MARPAKFTRQQILDAAHVLARRDGGDAVTARRLADELGASTAVFYSHFDGIPHLRAELFRTVVTGRVGLAVMDPNFLAHPMRVGIRALVDMAMDEPWVLQDYLAKPNKQRPEWRKLRNQLAGMLANIPRYHHMSLEQRQGLVARVTFPAIGLALVAGTGGVEDVDRAITAVLEPVIEAALRDLPEDDLLKVVEAEPESDA